MKIIRMIISIMLALVLCITPVTAVSADDFEVVIESVEDNTGCRYNTYTYCNMNNLTEQYVYIRTHGTAVLFSLVTFKPANIPDAPTMVVNTGSNNIFHYEHERIYLPRSVDEWEIKYYSNSEPLLKPDRDYLKNAGVINMKEFIEGYFMKGVWFDAFIEKGFYLELSKGQYLYSCKHPSYGWSIPEV